MEYDYGGNNHEGKIGVSVGMGTGVPGSASYRGGFVQDRLKVVLNNT